MAGEKRYLEIRYKDEDTGDWTDWSAQKELTDSLSWLNDHAGTSISAIEDFVADKTAVNSVLDEGVEDTIHDESHLYNPFAKSEMATVKLAVKLAGEDHVSYDSLEELVQDEATWDTVLASETAMDAIAGSETAMDVVVDLETAMNDVAASESAMDIVFNKDVALNTVISSESAMDAVWSHEPGSKSFWNIYEMDWGSADQGPWKVNLDLTDASELEFYQYKNYHNNYAQWVKINGSEVWSTENTSDTWYKRTIDVSDESGPCEIELGAQNNDAPWIMVEYEGGYALVVGASNAEHLGESLPDDVYGAFSKLRLIE